MLQLQLPNNVRYSNTQYTLLDLLILDYIKRGQLDTRLA